jgi:hypothetical protein
MAGVTFLLSLTALKEVQETTTYIAMQKTGFTVVQVMIP